LAINTFTSVRPKCPHFKFLNTPCRSSASGQTELAKCGKRQRERERERERERKLEHFHFAGTTNSNKKGEKVKIPLSFLRLKMMKEQGTAGAESGRTIIIIMLLAIISSAGRDGCVPHLVTYRLQIRRSSICTQSCIHIHQQSPLV